MSNIPSIPSLKSKLLFIKNALLLSVASFSSVFFYCVGGSYIDLSSLISSPAIVDMVEANYLLIFVLLQLTIVGAALFVHGEKNNNFHKADRVFLSRLYRVDTNDIVNALTRAENERKVKRELGRRYFLLKEALYARQTEKALLENGNDDPAKVEHSLIGTSIEDANDVLFSKNSKSDNNDATLEQNK